MARRFGWVRKLPSGRFQASYKSPHGERVNAPITFANEVHTWLSAQRTNIARGSWRAPNLGEMTLANYSVPGSYSLMTGPVCDPLTQGLVRLRIHPVDPAGDHSNRRPPTLRAHGGRRRRCRTCQTVRHEAH